MNLDEVREGMESYRVAADREADELKDPMLALERLVDLYRRLDEAERAAADQVLAEWLSSGDENKRYDAVALIRRFRVRTAGPSLRALVIELASSDDPGAPFEREKVEDLMTELGVSHDSQ